jgi:hypothetical protein
METTQPVSVPVLDARLAGLKTELLHHIYATFATQMALILGLLYFLFNHAK